MKIDYPTYRVKGHPTPNEKLVICDSCGYAKWTIFGINPIYCTHTRKHNGKNVRMREATLEEYKIGKEKLVEEIG